MSKEIQIFNNEQFGKIRMVEIDDKPYFVATDIAKALRYVNPNDAIKKHCRWVAKCEVPHPQSKNKTLEVNVIPEEEFFLLYQVFWKAQEYLLISFQIIWTL